jgi:hypothetical protein
MFYVEMTYLSTADRTRLEQLKEIEASARFSREERVAATEEKAEIEKRRKPLAETTYEEAQEYRVWLFGKYRKLVAAGAALQAQQFQQFIQRVEYQIMALQVDATKKALIEEQTKKEIGKGLRQPNGKPQPRRGPVSAGPTKNPWSIPVDDDS